MHKPLESAEHGKLPHWNADIVFCAKQNLPMMGDKAKEIAREAIKRIQNRFEWFTDELAYNPKTGIIIIHTDFACAPSAEEVWHFVRAVYGHFHDVFKEKKQDLIINGEFDHFPEKPVRTDGVIEHHLQQTGRALEKIGVLQLSGRDATRKRNEDLKNKAYDELLLQQVRAHTIQFTEDKLREWGARFAIPTLKTPIRRTHEGKKDLVEKNAIECPPGREVIFYHISTDKDASGLKKVRVVSQKGKVTISITLRTIYEQTVKLEGGLNSLSGAHIGLPGIILEISPEGFVTLTKESPTTTLKI